MQTNTISERGIKVWIHCLRYKIYRYNFSASFGNEQYDISGKH